jgi:hypothetical protein
VLGRAFAVVESTYWVATGVGALLAPALVALLGTRGALVAVGAALVVAVAARWAALGRLEVGVPVPERPFRALRSVSAFAPLPICRIEDLARRVHPVEAAPGVVLMREGEPGDCVYVLAEGAVAIDVHGEFVAERHAGEFIGEIAIVRHIPRTATVTCSTSVLLYELDREMFCAAISAHPRTSETVRATADRRLATVATT